MTDDPYHSKKSVPFLVLAAAIVAWMAFRVARWLFVTQAIFRAAAREAGPAAASPWAFLGIPLVVLGIVVLVLLAAVVLALKSRFDHRSRGPL